MGVVSLLREWLGSDDEGFEYVCINCGADLERNYRECPECGKPYVASSREVAAESDT